MNKEKTYDYQHPIVSDEMKNSVMRQLVENISIYDNGGIYQEVESSLKQLFGLKYALTCCNGTSALFSMYYGADIGRGDEVIVPAYTFFATASPLFLLGAVPILADCDESGNIDPEQVLAKITPKTKAIVVTHMWGIPGQMDRLLELASEHDVLLLEDASHAHGATYDDKVIGSFSDGAAWSLQGKKLLTAGEGGLFATKHQKFFERAVLLGHFNKRSKKEVFLPELVDFTTTGLGANLRMHPLGAAVLRPQIHSFSEQITQRREVASFLTKTINDIDGLSNVPVADNVNPAWYAFNFFFDASSFRVTREEFVDLLTTMGGVEFDIPGSTCPLNQHPLFTRPHDVNREYLEFAEQFGNDGSYPNADAFHSCIIKLPTWHGEGHMDYAKQYMNLLRECVARTWKHSLSGHRLAKDSAQRQTQGRTEGIEKFAVGAAIVSDNKVLFLRRTQEDFMGGIYELPSGTVETGEDPVTALLRETVEETGLIATELYGMISDFDYQSSSGASKRQFTFVVGIEDVSKLVLSAEHDTYAWLSKDELVNNDDLDDLMQKLGTEALALVESLL